MSMVSKQRPTRETETTWLSGVALSNVQPEPVDPVKYP